MGNPFSKTVVGDQVGQEFVRVNINSAELKDCKLINCNIRACDLRGCTVKGGTIREADITEGTLCEDVKVERADVRESKMERCTVSQADFIQATVSGGNLMTVDIKQNTLCQGVKIHKVDLYDCMLSNCEVSEFDAKGNVRVEGGSLTEGEQKPGSTISIHGNTQASRIDNYNPCGAWEVPMPMRGAAAPVTAKEAAAMPSPEPFAEPTGATMAPEVMKGREGNDAGAPARFICPITIQVMRSPVMTRTGLNYEHSAILAWISSHGCCPQTRAPLTAGELAPNRALQEEIDEWMAKHN